jgi:hypothetical protein
MRVARWYCRQSQTTFSLLPDCLSARLAGSLDDAEKVIVAAESLGVEASAHTLRLGEVGFPGLLRWMRRRRQGVRAAILALMTAVPGRLGTVPEVRALRSVLSNDRVLVFLREIGADHLHALPHPIGFRPLRRGRRESETGIQHETGPDPPGG